MDRSAEKQARIDRQRDETISRYPSIWDKLITGWNSPGPEDRAWLMYSASYLFRTRGVRWAIDPLTLKSRLPNAPGMEAARDLKELEFVLLTHNHKDHLDPGLLRLLRHLPIRWVVPESMLQRVQREIGLPVKQILVPRPLQPIELNGLLITPFEGLHWEAAPDYLSGRRGVPSIGYLVELGGKRWLFPGDTRTYDSDGLPDFGEVDLLFAHLWLGRGAALQSPPPLLELFCRFCLALTPQRIILTHLEEWGRRANNFWDLTHAGQAVSVLKKRVPSLSIEVASMGDEISLA